MDTVVAISLTRERRKLKLTITIPAGRFVQEREVSLDTQSGRVWAANAFKSLTEVVKSLQNLWAAERPQSERPTLDFKTMPSFRIPTRGLMDDVWGDVWGSDDDRGLWNYTTTTWSPRRRR